MRVLLFLALIYPAMASAWMSGNKLLALCDEPEDYRERGQCLGYLQGVDSANDTLRGWENFQPSYCLPENVTLGQIQAIVVKRLKENPEKLHLDASSSVINALFNAFAPEIKFEDGEPVRYCPE